MIFEQYSYKVKIKALAVIFILLSCTAYKRSFSTLLKSVEEYSKMKDKSDKLKSSSSNVYELRNELKKIDKIIGKEVVDKEKIQQDIISFTIGHKNTSIYDLRAIHMFKDDSFTIYTNQLDVTGNINDLLELAYNFEKSFSSSKLASLKFYISNKNNKPSVLHLKMIFQNYENNK